MTAQQLKNAILQEAIEGRLVPQDPNDEPASALLARIHKEKEQLVKAGKLKKKDLEVKPISEDEIPFEIPESWEWVRFSDLYWQLTDGTHSTPKYTTSGVPFLSVKDMSSGKLSFANTKYISPEEHSILSQRCHPQKGDMLLSKVGTTGVPLIIDTDKEFSIFVSLALVKFFPNLIDSKFLLYLINSPLVQLQAADNTRGVGNKNWVLKAISDTIMVLPPLAEQHRIVAKIEELMPKVEEYGKAQEKLNKLNEELPERLKKSILQEAIEGRLVPQDPNDEPASVLLAKIREEKKQLIKEGKLKKKDLEEEPISEDEIPFEIPDSWEWCRLGFVCDYLHRGKSPKYGTQKELPIIAQKCNQWDRIYTDRCLFSDTAYIDKYTLEQYLQVGDVIINSTGGGTVGRTGYVDTYVFDEYSHFVVDSHVTVVRGNKLIDSKYIYFFLISPYIQWGLEDRCSGSTNQIELGTSTIFNYFFPLPPLAEQHRIVEKIEQLFKEIDKLKTK